MKIVQEPPVLVLNVIYVYLTGCNAILRIFEQIVEIFAVNVVSLSF